MMKNISLKEIQTQLEKIEKDFAKIKRKSSPEVITIFNTLISLFKLMLLLVSSKLEKTSRNSHLSPSQDPHRNRQKKEKSKSNGAPTGHKGSTLSQSKTPDEIILLPLTNCGCCGKHLSQKYISVEKRQVFDLKVQSWITEYQSPSKTCSCGHTNQAKFPEDVNAPVQYGKKVKSLAVYMNQYQLIPLARTSEFFADQMKLSVSKGSIISWIKEASERLDFFEEEAKSELLNSSLIHADETGVIVDKKNFWFHCFSNELTTLYDVNIKRGSKAMDEMNVLSSFQGYLVHDFWSSYFNYDSIHIICNAHILRELNYSYEAEKQEWANKLKDLLSKSLLKRDNTSSGLTYNQIKLIEKLYDEIIFEAEKDCPKNQIRVNGSRGRLPQTKSRNLLRRLKDFKSSILMFLYDKEIPFTNNQGERDLRMIKVQQKVSGCFRTYEGAKNFCRIRSFISTMKKRGQSPEAALVEIFSRGS